MKDGHARDKAWIQSITAGNIVFYLLSMRHSTAEACQWVNA